jgi:hypothetical protein
MSRIEDLLMEAWEMGIKDQVIERVTQKQKELTFKDKWMSREDIYEEAMTEVKKEIFDNGSRN